MRAYLPGSWADRVQSVVQLSADTFTNFVSGQLTEACILGGAVRLGDAVHPVRLRRRGGDRGHHGLIPVMGAYIGAVLPAFSADGGPVACIGVSGIPGHPPADRGQCDLSQSGGHLHRPARYLGAGCR